LIVIVQDLLKVVVEVLEVDIVEKIKKLEEKIKR